MLHLGVIGIGNCAELPEQTNSRWLFTLLKSGRARVTDQIYLPIFSSQVSVVSVRRVSDLIVLDFQLTYYRLKMEFLGRIYKPLES